MDGNKNGTRWQVEVYWFNLQSRLWQGHIRQLCTKDGCNLPGSLQKLPISKLQEGGCFLWARFLWKSDQVCQKYRFTFVSTEVPQTPNCMSTQIGTLKGCKTNYSGANAFISFMLSPLPRPANPANFGVPTSLVRHPGWVWEFLIHQCLESVATCCNCRRASTSRNMPGSPKNLVPRSPLRVLQQAFCQNTAVDLHADVKVAFFCGVYFYIFLCVWFSVYMIFI